MITEGETETMPKQNFAVGAAGVEVVRGATEHNTEHCPYSIAVEGTTKED